MMNEVDTRASGSCCCGSGRGDKGGGEKKVEKLGSREEETGAGMGLI